MFTLALVTGATSGIGEAVARLLANKGISLLLTGRDEPKLQALSQELGVLVPVDTFTANLAVSSGREKAVAEIRKHAPDLVINNAGFGLYGPAVSFPVEKQVEVLEVDGVAVLQLTLAAAQTLKEKQKKGTILNVSSAAAFQVFPYFSVYAASKALVNHFSQSLDYELSEEGIRVLASCPGQVSTHFSERASGKKGFMNQGFLVMDVQEAAESIYKQIEKGEQIHIFNWKYRLLTALSKLVPATISTALVRKVVASRARKSDQGL